MWSETLKNGKVKFVERYKNPLTLKSQRVSVIMDKDTARTRKLAQAALNEKIDQALAGIMTPVKQENLRLSELVDLYAASQKTQRREKSITMLRKRCKRKIISRLRISRFYSLPLLCPFFCFREQKNTANSIVYGIPSSIFNAEKGT